MTELIFQVGANDKVDLPHVRAQHRDRLGNLTFWAVRCRDTCSTCSGKTLIVRPGVGDALCPKARDRVTREANRLPPLMRRPDQPAEVDAEEQQLAVVVDAMGRKADAAQRIREGLAESRAELDARLAPIRQQIDEAAAKARRAVELATWARQNMEKLKLERERIEAETARLRDEHVRISEIIANVGRTALPDAERMERDAKAAEASARAEEERLVERWEERTSGMRTRLQRFERQLGAMLVSDPGEPEAVTDPAESCAEPGQAAD